MTRRAIRLLAALLPCCALAWWGIALFRAAARETQRLGAAPPAARGAGGTDRPPPSIDEGSAIEAQRDRAASGSTAAAGDAVGSGSGRDEGVLLFAQRPRSFLLHVVDAASGAELRDVTVDDGEEGRSDRRFDAFGRRFESDRSLAPLALRGDSPLLVEPPSEGPRIGRLLIAAAGHEAVERRVDWWCGGERQVELRPAGSLRIAVQGAPSDAVLQLRLHQTTERGAALLQRRAERQLPHFGAATAVDSLAAGSWQVALFDLALPFEEQVAFAEAQVSEGASSELRLDYAAASRPTSVPFVGTITFDREWLAAAAASPKFALPVGLRLRQWPVVGLADPQLEWDVLLTPGERPEERRFDAQSAVPGDLAVEFPGWKTRYRTTLRVPSQGDTDVRVAIAAPAEVEVHAVGRDGPPRHTVPVVVMTAAAGPSHDGTPRFETLFTSGTYDDATLPWRMPSGWIELRGAASDGGRAFGDFGYPRAPAVAPFAPQRHFVAPGRNVIELAFDTLALLEVVLRDGATTLPWEASFTLTARRGGRVVAPLGQAADRDGPGLLASFEGEGPLELSVAGVPGYAVAEPLHVELRRGELVSVELPLLRRR